MKMVDTLRLKEYLFLNSIRHNAVANAADWNQNLTRAAMSEHRFVKLENIMPSLAKFLPWSHLASHLIM